MPRVGVNRLNLKFKHLKSDQKQVTRIVRDWGPDTPGSPDYPDVKPGLSKSQCNVHENS